MTKPVRKRATPRIKIEVGSGNFWEDLGFPDAEERLAKAELSIFIERAIKERNWSQKRAAEELGIAESDMSNVIRGKLRSFSLERLQRFLNALDLEVRIQVGPRPQGKRKAGVTVQRVASF